MVPGVSTSTRSPNDRCAPLVIATILRPEGATGVHTHSREFRQFLDDREVASTLVTPFSWHPALSAPVFGVRLPLAHLSSSASVTWYLHFHGVFLRKALSRHLRETTDSVVYAQDPVAARAALLARSGQGQRIVMAVHFKTSLADEWFQRNQITRYGPVYKFIRQLERAVIPRLDGIVYVSESARRELLTWLPQADGVPSVVIPNFIAPPSTRSVGPPLGDLVTVGSLEITKNHRFLLEVLARANQAGRTLTLDIFGDGSCRRDLERLTTSLGLTDHVRFRGFRPDVRDLLPRYKIYVHASYSEALPLAIIEAMSVGLPIVTYGTGGIPELCADGVEARYWQLDDHNKAASILLDLLDSELSRSTLGLAAADRFRRDFRSDHIAPRLYSFLTGDDVDKTTPFTRSTPGQPGADHSSGQAGEQPRPQPYENAGQPMLNPTLGQD